MNDFAEYMELIVEPTFEEYSKNKGSVRLAYLACLVAYHAVDRAAYPRDGKDLAREWRDESQEFMLIEEIAQHFKHGRRHWVRKAKEKDPDALLITHPLGLEGDLKGLELHSLPFLLRDVVIFLHKKLAAKELAKSIIARLELKVIVPFGKDPEARPRECHVNVDRWVFRHAEHKPVRGYLITNKIYAGEWSVYSHSVIEDENGELFDITPRDRSISYGFVRHIGTEGEFEAMKGDKGVHVSIDDC